jgi:hypothetical protein
MKPYATKTYGGVSVQIHNFLTSALVGGGWTASLHGHSIPGERAPIPTAEEAGLTPERIWTLWKGGNFEPYKYSNTNLSIVQPIPSHYTGCLKLVCSNLWLKSENCQGTTTNSSCDKRMMIRYKNNTLDITHPMEITYVSDTGASDWYWPFRTRPLFLHSWWWK